MGDEEQREIEKDVVPLLHARDLVSKHHAGRVLILLEVPEGELGVEAEAVDHASVCVPDDE
jgi:hypothetical protein